ncbi:UDP-forming cellulose synthase catalytic subunit [Spongiibacter sp. KMU-158]|uniref:Cellulose synthase catalytic subunit [UDP-forming] n=2 Tax=Spongiibacter pelagi TaxID=2760804 RepID=A0A927C1A6_9GAMM|nr:UDP-forming cellulose synthase catalytic subunit [Spongiibacter pelagi]
MFEVFRHETSHFNNIGRFTVLLWLGFSWLFLQSQIAGRTTWSAPATLFPKVNFSRPRWGDPLRLLIQGAWLICIRQTPSDTQPAFKPPLPKAYTPGDLRSVHWLFKSTALIRWGIMRAEKKLSLHQSYNPASDKALSRTQQQMLGIIVGCAMLLCISVPMDYQAQTIYVCVLLLVAALLRQVSGRFSTMLLMVLSVIVSSRYLWWRLNNSLNWDDALGLFFGLLIVAAEIYAWIVLLLGYFQNIWPLRRNPVPLPGNEQDWPKLDIFIPTYNEPLDVVKATIYACLGLDWPRDKFEIHLLDDGKRDTFKDFAKDVGINYIRRPTNEHAKAGNINYALKQTTGEYVAIFDCDHIPTRGFFQLSMGWFLKDPKLALIQTPHHFYSPDPFERNLSHFHQVPSEGTLFYGLTQDGNDLWNGSFFCGSCAIIRRIPLEEIGGIAVETVTEDAHTSLRLHRKGYNSAYLRVPISAGLATETLSAHIGQRIRWARGMTQILRLDNPLRGPGLKWHQRLCYFNAMMHFLSGIPRLIFLTAPLVFLLLHTYVIYAPAGLLLLYVIPHMFHSSLVNSKVHGKYRYSFWGEVYETVLAWYVARPTIVALFAPHKGTFNVTAKGGRIDEEYFDWVISKPYLLLIALNVLGCIWGGFRLAFGPETEIAAVLVNMAWTLYNLLLLGAAAAVARELKQIRSTPRVVADIPVSLALPSGHRLSARLRDFSFNGMRIEHEATSALEEGQILDVIMERAGEYFAFSAKVMFSNNTVAGLQLQYLDHQEMTRYVQCTFARSDNWIKSRGGFHYDRPGFSFKQIAAASLRGYQQFLEIGPKPLPQIYYFYQAVRDKIYSYLPTRIQSARHFSN